MPIPIHDFDQELIDLRKALRELLDECRAAGFTEHDGYNWGTVIPQAEKALRRSGS